MENKTIVIMMSILLIVGVVASVAITSYGNDVYTANQVNLAKQELNQQLSEKQNQITNLSNQISDLTTQNSVLENQIKTSSSGSSGSTNGYLIDGLYLNNVFSKVLSHREVSKLVDSKVSFKDNNYDVQEIVQLSNLSSSINGKDFQENTYLSVPRNGIEYSVSFESSLNTSQVSVNDPLEFSFLGNNVKITDWSSSGQITMSLANEQYLHQGDNFTVDNKVFTVTGIYDTAVAVSEKGTTVIIDNGKTKTIDGVEVEVSQVLPSSAVPSSSMVVLNAGKDVSKTITNGDSYTDGSAYKYVITSNSIGLTLKEDFNRLNTSSGFNAISSGSSLCLPNNYVCVDYNGLSTEKVSDYTFSMDGNSILIEGDLVAGLSSYNKVYVNNGSVFEDYDLSKPINSSVYFGDSNVVLNINGSNLGFESIKLLNNLSSVSVNSNDISANENNYRTVYGSVIESPKSSSENQEFTVSIPKNQLETSVSVI